MWEQKRDRQQRKINQKQKRENQIRNRKKKRTYRSHGDQEDNTYSTEKKEKIYTYICIQSIEPHIGKKEKKKICMDSSRHKVTSNDAKTNIYIFLPICVLLFFLLSFVPKQTSRIFGIE